MGEMQHRLQARELVQASGSKMAAIPFKTPRKCQPHKQRQAEPCGQKENALQLWVSKELNYNKHFILMKMF